MPDHVHMMISIPPKYAVSEVVGYIKGKSAIHLARVFQMAFFNPALLPLREVPEYLAQVLPKLPVQRFATAFGNENYMVFALPFAVA
jgi:REP element-mobilizing transposase RayT